MKKVSLIIVLFIFLPYFGYNQISKQKDITSKEVSNELNKLMRAGDRAAVIKEAQYLANSDIEELAVLSLPAYSWLEGAEQAALIENKLLQKFPNGKYAQYKGYLKLLEITDNSVQLEEALKTWETTFSVSRNNPDNAPYY